MTTATPASRTRTTLALTFVGHGLCHGSKVALPMITLTRAADDLGADIGFMGLCVTSFTMAMAASSVPSGLIGDRHGTARVLAVNLLLTAVACVACAVAPERWSFLLAYSLLGFAAGAFHPAALGLLSLSIPGDRLGRAMGSFGVAGSIGMASMPLLMSETLGWRTGFGVMAAVSLAAGVCTVVAVRRHVLLPGVPEPEGPGADEDWTPTRRSSLALLLMVIGVSGFLLDGFMVLTPENVSESGAFAIEPSALLASILLLSAAGQWMGGLLSRERNLAGRYALLLVLQPLVLFAIAASLGALGLGFALMGLFAFLNTMLQPVENRLLATFTSRARRSTAYALKFVVALALAAPASLFVAELLQGGWPHASIWRILGAIGLLAATGGALFRTRVQRQQPVETPG